MTARSVRYALASIGFSLLFALTGCGPTPSPDTAADAQKENGPDEGGGSQGNATNEGPANDTQPMSHGAKKATGEGSADDYTLTAHDCQELGRQYAAVQRADQIKQLSPKLTDKQRAQAEKNIDEVIGAMGDTWAAGCMESLVGKVVERKRLSCAMAAKTVETFADCINAEGPEPQ
jgi:hypothetical protein